MWLSTSFVLKHPPLDRCCQETEKCYVVFTVALFNLRFRHNIFDFSKWALACILLSATTNFLKFVCAANRTQDW